MTLQFTLLVEPKSVQHGARAGLRKGKIRFYNDSEKTSYQTRLMLEAKHHAPMEPFKGAVSLCYQFWMDKPKSSKNDLAIVKPDLDNLSKGLTDALSKCGFWKDDCQIIALTAVKVYNDTPLPPRIEIKMDFAS